MALHSAAQKRETYYDYLWKPCDPQKARFYSVVKFTDSGWLRNDYYMSNSKPEMTALYADSTCKILNGRMVYFFPDGKVKSYSQKVMNRLEGLYLAFHYNGMIADSAMYHNGRFVGNKYSWHENGVISDSISHLNDSVDVAVNWFETGAPASAGYFLHGKQHGKWQYFHRSGKVAARESYENGKLVSAEYFNEDGSVQTDTASTHRNAVFQGGIEDWQRYLGKHLYWPTHLRFANDGKGVVVVEMSIDENGKVQSANVAVPFHPDFDRIALRVLKDSPTWRPAMAHNRRVWTTFRQPVTFSQGQ